MHFRANLLYLMSPNLKNDRKIIASHFENAIPNVYWCSLAVKWLFFKSEKHLKTKLALIRFSGMLFLKCVLIFSRVFCHLGDTAIKTT